MSNNDFAMCEDCETPRECDSAGTCGGASCGMCQSPGCLQCFPTLRTTEPPAEKALARVVQDFKGAVDGGGYKRSMDDKSKIPLGLIPPALMREVGKVLQHGALKYAPGNWLRGMDWSQPADALQRHMLAWSEGEDTDPESGLSHLAHAACCLAFLLHYTTHEKYAQFDNRMFKGE